MFEPGLIAGPPLVPSNETKLDIVAPLREIVSWLELGTSQGCLFIRSGKIVLFL